MVLPSGVGEGAKGCQAADRSPGGMGTAESGKLLAGHAAGQAQAGQIFGALIEDESDSEDEGPPGVVDSDGEEDYEEYRPAAGEPSPQPQWQPDDEEDDACFENLFASATRNP